MRKTLAKTMFLVLLPVVHGCATATYGKTFEQTQTQSQYTAKIYTSIFASEKQATDRLDEESKKFMTEKGYKSYKVLSAKSAFFPVSFVTYVVQFSK